MENSNHSWRRLRLFWVGICLLVLAGMCLDCSKAPETATDTTNPTPAPSASTPSANPQTITITGASPGYGSPLNINVSRGDKITWQDSSSDGSPVAVCINEKDPTTDHHVFKDVRIPIASGKAVPATVQTKANMGAHNYGIVSGDKSCDANAPVQENVVAPPKTITVQ